MLYIPRSTKTAYLPHVRTPLPISKKSRYMCLCVVMHCIQRCHINNKNIDRALKPSSTNIVIRQSCLSLVCWSNCFSRLCTAEIHLVCKSRRFSSSHWPIGHHAITWQALSNWRQLAGVNLRGKQYQWSRDVIGWDDCKEVLSRPMG